MKSFQIETIIPIHLQNFLVLQHNPKNFVGIVSDYRNYMYLQIFSKEFKLEKKVDVGCDEYLIECQKGKMVVTFDGRRGYFVDIQKGKVVHEIYFYSDSCCCYYGWCCLFNNNIILLHDYETIKLIDEYSYEVIKEIKYKEDSFGNPIELFDCSDCNVFYTDDKCMFGIMDITFKNFLIQEEEK